MGIIRKAAVGSLIVGLGAIALSKNKKAVNKISKNLSAAAKNVLKSASKNGTAAKKSVARVARKVKHAS